MVRGRHVRHRRPVLPVRRDPGAAARLRRHGPRGDRPAAADRPTGARVIWSVAVVLTVALVAVLLTAPERTSTEELIAANERELVLRPVPRPAPALARHGRDERRHQERQTTKVPAVEADWSMPKGSEIDAFGDSMLVGAIHAMRYYLPKVRVDAKSNRTLARGAGPGRGPRAVAAAGRRALARHQRRHRRQGHPPHPQGARPPADGRHRHRARPFARAEADNAALREIVEDLPNVRLAEWDAALAGTSGQLQPDGIHPSLKGSHLYAKTVRQAFADLSQAHTGTAGDAQGPAAALTLEVPSCSHDRVRSRRARGSRAGAGRPAGSPRRRVGGRPSAVLVAGDAGIGKTRLVEALRERRAAPDALVLVPSASTWAIRASRSWR